MSNQIYYKSILNISFNGTYGLQRH